MTLGHFHKSAYRPRARAPMTAKFYSSLAWLPRPGKQDLVLQCGPPRSSRKPLQRAVILKRSEGSFGLTDSRRKISAHRKNDIRTARWNRKCEAKTSLASPLQPNANLFAPFLSGQNRQGWPPFRQETLACLKVEAIVVIHAADSRALDGAGLEIGL